MKKLLLAALVCVLFQAPGSAQTQNTKIRRNNNCLPPERSAICSQPGQPIIFLDEGSPFAALVNLSVGPTLTCDFPSGGPAVFMTNTPATGLLDTGGGLQPFASFGPYSEQRAAPNGDIIPTEIVQMSLIGTGPFANVLLRESPTLPSMGQYKVTDLGGGQYEIESFFDVFFEISTDFGTTFKPAQASVRLTGYDLQPEPGSWVMFPAAAAALALVRRRRGLRVQ